MDYRFIWKVRHGDFYEQEFRGFLNMASAMREWHRVSPHTLIDLEKFEIVEMPISSAAPRQED